MFIEQKLVQGKIGLHTTYTQFEQMHLSFCRHFYKHLAQNPQNFSMLTLISVQLFAPQYSSFWNKRR